MPQIAQLMTVQLTLSNGATADVGLTRYQFARIPLCVLGRCTTRLTIEYPNKCREGTAIQNCAIFQTGTPRLIDPITYGLKLPDAVCVCGYGDLHPCRISRPRMKQRFCFVCEMTRSISNS